MNNKYDKKIYKYDKSVSEVIVDRLNKNSNHMLTIGGVIVLFDGNQDKDILIDNEDIYGNVIDTFKAEWYIKSPFAVSRNLHSINADNSRFTVKYSKEFEKLKAYISLPNDIRVDVFEIFKDMSEKSIEVNGIKMEKYSIGYLDLPKVACTSMKELIYELDTGKPFSRQDTGMNSHQYYNKRKIDISDSEFKFIIIRDPIKRFLSGYSNRVNHYEELSYTFLNNRRDAALQNIIKNGTPFNPDLNQFIQCFSDYYETISIKHHFKPITQIVNVNLDFFNQVYRIEDIGLLERDLSTYMNRTVKIPKKQTGGKKYELKDLSVEQMDFLIDFYKEDYKLMEKYYTVDDIWNIWKK